MSTPSVTAEITCAQRAVEHLTAEHGRLIDDPYARSFVRTPSFRMRMAHPSIACLTRRVFDQRYPGYMAIVLLRNRHYEDVLAHARADGIDQIVLVGAGYDTTAFRLPLDGTRLFEIDTPATQEEKRARIARYGLVPTCPVEYVPCDVTRDDLVERLDAHSFETDRRCLVSWLGVSYFLAAPHVERTLAQIARLSAPGSLLVWDHMDPEVVDGTTPYSGARRARRVVARRGEPYRFGVTNAEAATLVGGHGFTVVEHLRLPELGQRYGGATGVWCRTDDFAGVMTAVRAEASAR